MGINYHLEFLAARLTSRSLAVSNTSLVPVVIGGQSVVEEPSRPWFESFQDGAHGFVQPFQG